MLGAHPHDEKYYEVDQDLFSWLGNRRQEEFPLGADYVAQFNALRPRIDTILRDVDKAALLAEAQKSMERGETNPEDIIYLTNHGPEHVKQVVQRATDLLRDSGCELSPYEGYILLTAILFHDVGNIFGRKNHEVKAWKIMNDLGSVAGTDQLERKTIIKIALVHGGTFGGSKDTIIRLQEKDDVLGRPVRKRLLAAILRFADELADDYSRASRYMLDADQIPPNSQIYHRYSDSLKSVRVEHAEVRLRFDFDEEEALKEYIKNGRPTFLLDELNERALKMHRERMYCMRYMRPHIDISRIHVDITIYAHVGEMIRKDNQRSALLDPERVQYTLVERGYPECQDGSFLANCSGGSTLRTGVEMKSILEDRRSMRNA